MKNWELTRNNILAAQVPDNTSSYTAIPHRVFLEEISEKLSLKGYNIQSEQYIGTKEYQIITGSFTVNKTGVIEGPKELAPSLFFVNSYNKARRAIIRAGAKVLVCKNGMLGTVDGGVYTRKHSGNALEEFREHIDVVIDNLDYEFEKLQKNVVEMKEIQMDRTTIARLVGDMVINEDMVTMTQLSILKHELKFSENFKDGSLWSFYNNCTEAFKETHPMYYDQQHIKLHTYLSDKFELTGSRGLYGKGLDGISINPQIIELEAEEI